jgi:ribonuclease HII
MIGIDEVGRGCLAGPLLVVAARQVNDLPEGLADSKVLNRRQREELFILLDGICEFGEGWVKSTEIDRLGLTKAMRLGVRRALNALNVVSEEKIIMDGPVNYLPKKFRKVQCLIDADATVPLVSAASIFAKVSRDRYMTELAKKHPRYGFDSHVGYGTSSHLAALQKFGSLKRVHRQFYSPIKSLRELEAWPLQP